MNTATKHIASLLATAAAIDAAHASWGALDAARTEESVSRSIQAALRRWLVASGIAEEAASVAVRDLGHALRDLRDGAAELVAIVADPDIRAGWDCRADAATVVAAGDEGAEAEASWEIYADGRAPDIWAGGPIAQASRAAWIALRVADTRAYAAEHNGA